jgi:hypothetical protein
MSLFIVTDTKIVPYGDESVMGAIHEAEKLRDRTGKRVSVVRDAGLKSQRGICTFLGFPEWNPEPKGGK